MGIDEGYTNDDHQARDNDVYAIGKYKWTLRVLARQRPAKDMLIANIGCGAGTFNRMLAEDGYRVHAVEPDPAPFAIARACLPEGCTIENKGLFDIDGAARFDVIVMHDVLEHIEDDSRAVKVLAHLLKPGGLLIISVPAMQSLFGRHDEQLGHFRRYSKRTLRRTLGVATEVSSVRYYGFMSIPIAWIFSKKLRRDFPDVWGSGDLSLVRRVYGLMCDVESRIREPLGTALLAVAHNPQGR